MKVLKILIPTLTLVLIASQLLNSCAVSPNELLDMYERQQAVTIEVAYPENQEQGTEKELNWTELAFLETYPEFRDLFDSTLGITKNNNGKQGVVYVNLDGNHTNNSTLRYAFANAKFHTTFWNNTEAMNNLTKEIQKTYTDITDDSMAKYAIINSYFNIFPDAEPNYFNGNQTLTRGEFMGGLFRAGNPVQELQSDYTYESIVDPASMDQNTIYASQLQNYSYLTTEDQSLNSGTFQGTITRGEAIYTVVKIYYADEYNRTEGSESSYSDAKNGGDIALKIGFKDKKTGTVKDYWKSYELSHSLQNPDEGMPSDLYRALVVAKNHNLIVGSESRWDDGLTKKEAIQLITKVYESLGTYTNSNGITGTVDNSNNENSGSTIDNNDSQNNNESNDSGFKITEEDFFYDANGHIQYTIELIDYIKSFENYSNYDNYQISMIIESEPFEQMFNMGKTLGDIQGTLANELNEDATHDYIKKKVPALHFDFSDTIPSDPAGNGGYGDTSKVEDSNKGGSDEDERTPEDEQQGIDMSDKVDPSTGELKPSPTPIPTDTPVEEGPDIIVETPEDKTPQFTYEKFYKTMYATDTVNIRKGPSTDFEKTGNLTKGQQVVVYGRCNETGWYMLADADTMSIVFVADAYLSETPPATPSPTPTATTKPTATPKPTEAPSQSEQAKPTPTETPKQDTGSSSETTKPDGTVETQIITFTYQGLDENKNEITYEEELIVQGTYIDGYFIPDGLEEKVGYGYSFESEDPDNDPQLIAWTTKYPNAEVFVKRGVVNIWPAGRNLSGIGNIDIDGLGGA